MAFPRARSHLIDVRTFGLGHWLIFRAGLSRVLLGAFICGVVSAVLFGSEGSRAVDLRLPIAAYVVLAMVSVVVAAAIMRSCAGTGAERVQAAFPLLLAGMFFLAGHAVAESRLAALDHSPLRLMEAGTSKLAVRLVLEEDARLSGRRVSARARVLEAGRPGEPLTSLGGEGALLQVDLPSSPGATPPGGVAPHLIRGMIVSLDAGIELLDDSAVRERLGPSYADYLWRESVHALIRAGPRDIRTEGMRGGFAGAVDGLRRSAVRHLGLGVSEEAAGLLCGVVLGDKSRLSEEAVVSFRRSGLSHMLATSGLHVAALAGVALAVLLGAGVHRRAALVASLALIAGFACLVGLGVSILRASVMAGLALLGEAFGRGRDKWQGLFLAATAVLLSNPYQVKGAAFQLSFSAVAGLFVLARPLQECIVRRTRLSTSVAGLLSVSTAAAISTAPVSFLTFGDTAVFGVAANLLVVPLLPAVMALGFAAMAAGFVWGPAAALLDSLSAIVMGWVVQVAGLFARLPTASEIGVGPLLSVAVGASVGLLLRIRRTKRGRLGLAVVGALVGLLLAVGGSFLWARVGAPLWAEPWPAVVEVRVLDVGQGNATLIRTPGGRAILIDGGPADCRLAKQLSWLRVRKLDMVVVSHPHADHFAGLSECWGSIPIFGLIDGFPPAEPGLSVMGSGEEGDKNGDITGYLKLRSELIDSGAVYTPAAEISTFELEGVQVTVLNQELSARTLGSAAQRSGGGSSLSGEELNAASLVLVVRVGGVVILLPGDAEASVLARLPLEEVSVLVVSHHGSRGAVDERRLATLAPRLALISVGEGNSFGHPHPEVIGDLAKAACPVLRTDEVGSVALLVAEEGLQLRTDRPSSAVGARD